MGETPLVMVGTPMVTVIGREARVEATRSTPPWRRIVADLEAQTPMWCVVSRRNLDMMAAAGRVALFVLHVRAGMPRTLMLRWAARLQLASLVQVVRNYDDEFVAMMSWLDLALSSPLRISLSEENVLFLTEGGFSLFSKDMVLLL
jgi:hypothetical protein